MFGPALVYWQSVSYVEHNRILVRQAIDFTILFIGNRHFYALEVDYVLLSASSYTLNLRGIVYANLIVHKMSVEVLDLKMYHSITPRTVSARNVILVCDSVNNILTS